MAGPLSPLKTVLPVPANVVIIPVDTVTLRIRLLKVSAMYTLPSRRGGVITRQEGNYNLAVPDASRESATG